MFQQITKGIRISVITEYNGDFLNDGLVNYAFTYTVKIENQSNDVVQLINRNWKILQTNRRPYFVEGDGVIGQKPILKSGVSHTYSSNCLLNSPIGSMSGFYTMINFSLLLVESEGGLFDFDATLPFMAIQIILLIHL